MTEGQEIKLAKRLAILFAEQGEACLPEVKPTLEKILESRSQPERKRFLKLFSKYITKEFTKDTLTVESAEAITDETIASLRSSFSKNHARPLHVLTEIRPELISGLRVRLGDTVYDATILGKLDNLANAVH